MRTLVGLSVFVSCLACMCGPAGERDLDGDGVGLQDCDDQDPGSYPGAEEIPYDGIDQDCDGEDLVDIDGDGFDVWSDCDDEASNAYPGASEIYYDGVDNDCKPRTNDQDQDKDGVELSEDCDDTDPDVSMSGTYFEDADGDGFGSAGQHPTIGSRTIQTATTPIRTSIRGTGRSAVTGWTATAMVRTIPSTASSPTMRSRRLPSSRGMTATCRCRQTSRMVIS